MRPLTLEETLSGGFALAPADENEPRVSENLNSYDQNLARLRSEHHSQCLFNREPALVPGLRFWFDNAGVLSGEFNCNGFQQGYDNMVHGGVVAAIVDASMAQCLMGHAIVGYTMELSIKYRKPVLIRSLASLKTWIKEVAIGRIYILKSEITQNRHLVVQATGRFYKK